MVPYAGCAAYSENMERLTEFCVAADAVGRAEAQYSTVDSSEKAAGEVGKQPGRCF